MQLIKATLFRVNILMWSELDCFLINFIRDPSVQQAQSLFCGVIIVSARASSSQQQAAETGLCTICRWTRCSPKKYNIHLWPIVNAANSRNSGRQQVPRTADPNQIDLASFCVISSS